MRTLLANITADNHLEPRAWAKYPTLEGDSYISFSQITGACRRDRVPMINAGDALNISTPDASTVRFFCYELGLMADQGLETLYIEGQHEMSKPTPWLSIARGTWHVDGQQFTIGRFNCYGLNWQPADKLADALTKIPPGTDILVAHQVWHEKMGRLRSCEGKLADVPHVKMIITGDYHRHDITKVSASDGRGDIIVASPGSICMQTSDESQDKYYFKLYDDGSLESVKIRTRPVVYGEFINPGTFSQDLANAVRQAQQRDENLEERIRMPIASIKYDEAIPDAGPAITKAFTGVAHLFLSTFTHKPNDAEPEIERVDHLSVDTVLEETYRDKDPAVFASAMRLLNSKQPPKAEAEAIVADHMLAISNPWETT